MGFGIGDLFLRAAVDDKGFEADLVKKAGKAGDKAGTTLGAKLTGGFKKAGAGLMDGLKLGAGIAAFGALDKAISTVVGVLGDAVQAAREDQASIAGLGASLRANITNWDGNTDAIERTITARQRLGFTDEEQRKSMELLVGATHDVAKAQDIARVAMDLAVRKHISLEEASTALIKVEGGQYRALKALGVILPKNATATEALAAAQKVVAGAAEAEANTDQGKLKAAQIALGERLEKLGYELLPIVTEAMLAVAETAGPVIEGIVGIVTAIKDADAWLTEMTSRMGLVGDGSNSLDDAFADLGDGMRWLVNQELDLLDHGTRVADQMARELPEGMDKAGSAMTGFTGAADEAALGIGGSFKKIADGSELASEKVIAAVDAVTARFDAARAEWTAAGEGTAAAFWDPQIAKMEEAANLREIAETEAAIKSGKLKGDELADAKLHLAELNKTEMGMLATLASFGDKKAESTLKHMIEVERASGKLSKEQIAWLDRLEKQIDDTAAAARNLTNALASSKVTKPGGPNQARDAGGPTDRNTPYWIGLNRQPELMVPGAGHILTRAQAQTAVAGASSAQGEASDHSITINATGILERDTPLQIANAVRRAQRVQRLSPDVRRVLRERR